MKKRYALIAAIDSDTEVTCETCKNCTAKYGCDYPIECERGGDYKQYCLSNNYSLWVYVNERHAEVVTVGFVEKEAAE